MDQDHTRDVVDGRIVPERCVMPVADPVARAVIEVDDDLGTGTDIAQVEDRGKDPAAQRLQVWVTPSSGRLEVAVDRVHAETVYCPPALIARGTGDQSVRCVSIVE